MGHIYGTHKEVNSNAILTAVVALRAIKVSLAMVSVFESLFICCVSCRERERIG